MDRGNLSAREGRLFYIPGASFGIQKHAAWAGLRTSVLHSATSHQSKIAPYLRLFAKEQGHLKSKAHSPKGRAADPSDKSEKDNPLSTLSRAGCTFSSSLFDVVK